MCVKLGLSSCDQRLNNYLPKQILSKTFSLPGHNHGTHGARTPAWWFTVKRHRSCDTQDIKLSPAKENPGAKRYHLRSSHGCPPILPFQRLSRPLAAWSSAFWTTSLQWQTWHSHVWHTLWALCNLGEILLLLVLFLQLKKPKRSWNTAESDVIFVFIYFRKGYISWKSVN